MMKVFILSIFIIFSASAQGVALHCAQLLEQNFSSSATATTTYMNLLRSLIQHKNALNSDDIELLISQKLPVNPFNVVRTSLSTEERYAFNEAFEKILSGAKAAPVDWAEIKAQLILEKDQKDGSETSREETAEKTKSIFAVLPSQRIEDFKGVDFEEANGMPSGEIVLQGYRGRDYSRKIEVKRLNSNHSALIDIDIGTMQPVQLFETKAKKIYGYQKLGDNLQINDIDDPSFQITLPWRELYPENYKSQNHFKLFENSSGDLVMATTSMINFMETKLVVKNLSTGKVFRNSSELTKFGVMEGKDGEAHLMFHDTLRPRIMNIKEGIAEALKSDIPFDYPTTYGGPFDNPGAHGGLQDLKIFDLKNEQLTAALIYKWAVILIKDGKAVRFLLSGGATIESVNLIDEKLVISFLDAGKKVVRIIYLNQPENKFVDHVFQMFDVVGIFKTNWNGDVLVTLTPISGILKVHGLDQDFSHTFNLPGFSNKSKFSFFRQTNDGKILIYYLQESKSLNAVQIYGPVEGRSGS